MSWRRSILGWVVIAVACLAAFGGGYLWGASSNEGRFSDGHATEIFRALLKYEGGISRNDCEAGVLKVDDFVSSYLDRSFVIKNSNARSFTCREGGILQCSWSFGKDSSNEAWGRILNFEYDAALNKIVSGSVSCLDVP